MSEWLVASVAAAVAGSSAGAGVSGSSVARTTEDGGGGFCPESDGVRSHDLQSCQLRVDSLVQLTLDVIQSLGRLGEVESHGEWVKQLVHVPAERGEEILHTS